MIDPLSMPPVSTHDAAEDPRNETIKISINGTLYPKHEAKVSVYDSGFMMGDGVWEGLRLYEGTIAFLEDHLDRLFEAAKAIDLSIGMSKAALAEVLYATLDANAMEDGVHIRLMVTRGRKKNPFQDPRLSVFGPTVVILPEYKIASPSTRARGISLFTVHVHRQTPDSQDPKLNSHSKLNCILALIQALKAGGDEALMLDPHGFVNTCNSTNFFIIRKGEVWTSSGDYAMKGITRAKVIDLCRREGLVVREGNYSLLEAYGAEEAFVTGTFGGQTPVVAIDGRPIGTGQPGPMVEKIHTLYHKRIAQERAENPRERQLATLRTGT